MPEVRSKPEDKDEAMMVNNSTTFHLNSLHIKETKTFAIGNSCHGFRQAQTCVLHYLISIIVCLICSGLYLIHIKFRSCSMSVSLSQNITV
jgi:hypothetical protein